MNVTVGRPARRRLPDGLAERSGPLPNVSNLNFAPGQTVPNLVVARIGTGGKVERAGQRRAPRHVLMDVVGWFGSGDTTIPGARLLTQTPERKLDTRVGIGGPGGADRRRTAPWPCRSRLPGRASPAS